MPDVNREIKIVIYTLNDCPYCTLAKDLLKKKGASFEERNISDSEELEKEMSERTGRNTLPQIFIGEKHVGGFDDLNALDKKGELDRLLGIKGEKKLEKWTRLLIIGSGPAGLTSAIYAARADLEPLVLSGRQPGGQLTTTTEVENYPGFVAGIMGPELMDIMRKQAERFGATFLDKELTDVDVKARPFKVTAEDSRILADCIIIASGASAQFMGLPAEKELLGHGVSTCATCDAFFFRGRDVAVVGGGDSALEEAIFLTKFATKIYLIHRRDKLRASKIMQDKAFKNEKITFVWDSVIDDIMGNKADGVKSIKVKNIKSSALSDISCQGVFVAIGHKPNTAPWAGKIELDKAGYIVSSGTKTSVEGIFCAGDVQDHVYRQAVTAAGSGCMAALDAEKYLESLDN